MLLFLRSLISVDFDCPCFICRNTQSLVEQFSKKPACFFILTNSRSLSSDKVRSLPPEAHYAKLCSYQKQNEAFFLESKLSLGVSVIKLPMLSRNGASYRPVP